MIHIVRHGQSFPPHFEKAAYDKHASVWRLCLTIRNTKDLERRDLPEERVARGEVRGRLWFDPGLAPEQLGHTPVHGHLLHIDIEHLALARGGVDRGGHVSGGVISADLRLFS